MPTPERRPSVALAFASLVAFSSCRESTPVHADVSYDERFGEETVMDVYEPERESTGELHPAVMFIHGGGWRGGSKDEYTTAAQRLARSGYVAATINYRLVPGGQYPRLVQDCLCALAYLRTNAPTYRIDPDRIAVMGYSAGGHLASLVGVSADDALHAPDCKWGRTGPPRAIIAGAGIHDLRGKDNFLMRDLFGQGPDEAPERYARASPITHVAPGKPPYLFVHGTADWFIDEDQATVMRDALLAAGNEARIHEVAGGGHLLQATSDGQLAGEESDLTAESWITVIDFLDRSTRRRP